MPQAQQLGRYHLLDRIAYGGMAEIFRAKTFDAQGNVHLVAIKRLLSHLITDDEFLQMLIDEAKIAGLLQHPNIARVYEFGHAGDEYFLAMEFVDGKDVRAILEKQRQAGRPVAPEHAAWIAMEVAQALHAAHIQRDAQGAAMRIVHRDVSPSNVLCSYRGDVKLCDFGIAKATLTRVQTKTGVIKGKVKYMSPEQAMGRKLDHRSDVFSLGTCLYEMLTLQAPFQAQTEVELIFSVRDARKRNVRDLSPEVPVELQVIVDKAMTRSRSARYQSGEQMALELRQFLDQYRPGYRRSNFSRYMRKLFAAEIERELRQLENYTIEAAAADDVGENLIGDVLGPDAPFTRFTPVLRRGQPAPSPAQGPAGPPPDLHDRRTMILDGLQLGLRRPIGPSDFHDQMTQLKFPTALHEAETRVFSVTRGLPGVAGHNELIEEDDRERRERREAERRPSRDGDTSRTPRVELSDLLDEDRATEQRPPAALDFHDQETRIIDIPSSPTRAAVPRGDLAEPPRPLRGPERPQRSETTGVVRLDRIRRERERERDKSGARSREPSEETSMPLGDDDLEEI